MAKKAGVNKTQAVAEYMKANPEAGNTEIAKALTKKGIKINAAHVGNIKSTLKRVRRAKKAETEKAAEAPTVPATEAVSVAAKPGDMITLDQIRKVALTVKAIGGVGRLKELLEVVREVGGLKKFKDLLEAMALTEEGKAQP